jgi:hypothetical protein
LNCDPEIPFFGNVFNSQFSVVLDFGDSNFDFGVNFNSSLFNCDLHIVFDFSNSNDNLLINSALINKQGFFFVSTKFDFELD